MSVNETTQNCVTVLISLLANLYADIDIATEMFEQAAVHQADYPCLLIRTSLT